MNFTFYYKCAWLSCQFLLSMKIELEIENVNQLGLGVPFHFPFPSLGITFRLYLCVFNILFPIPEVGHELLLLCEGTKVERRGLDLSDWRGMLDFWRRMKFKMAAVT